MRALHRPSPTTAQLRGLRRSVLTAALIAGCHTAAVQAQAPPTQLPLRVHTAQIAGRPVAPADFIAERIARANQIFAAYGVAFVVTAEQKLDETHAQLVTREDRDALGAQVQRGVIDCFVVESLGDVDEPGHARRGVHWHSRTHPDAHFVIVSVIAGLDVLAHELGHFLGNPEHSETPGNLMSYQRGEVQPFLDAVQIGKLQRALRGYLRRGELRALGTPATRAQH